MNAWAHAWKSHEQLWDFTWSSVHVNLNTVSKRHADKNNEGPSLIVAAGKFTGGEFVLEEGDPIDLRGKAWKFDGRRIHWSKDFKGTRISFIWFCHTSWRQASKDQLEMLAALGFQLPEKDDNKKIKRWHYLPGTVVNGSPCQVIGSNDSSQPTKLEPPSQGSWLRGWLRHGKVW